MPQAALAMVPAPAAAVPTMPAVAAANAQHMEYMHEILQTILKHPLLQGLDSKKPKDQGAKYRPVDPKHLQKALAQGKEATGGGNLFWVDLGIDPAVAHTPIKSRKCREMADRYFSTPKHLISEVTVACPPAWREPGQIELGKQTLRRISPLEPLHALLIAVHRDVVAEDAEAIKGWKDVLLSTNFCFEIAESDDSIHNSNTQLREKAGIEHELIRHSSLSRILDVCNFSSRVGKDLPKLVKGRKVSYAKQISEAYNKDLVMSELSEPVSDAFVERALSVNNRMLSKSTYVLSKLMYLDDVFGVNGPLDSVHKLHVFLGKTGCGTNAVRRMEWLIGYLVDLYEHGAIGNDKCSKSELAGVGKGFADVVLCKQDFLEQILQWAQEAGMKAETLDKLKEITVSLEKFRDVMGRRWSTKAKPPATPWRAMLPPSGDLLISLVEDLVYHVAYDDMLLTWLLSKKSIADALTMSPLKDALDEIKQALESEQSAEGADEGSGKQEVVAMDQDDDGLASCVKMMGLDGDETLQTVMAQLKASDDQQDVEDLQKLGRVTSQVKSMVNSYVTLAPESWTDQDLQQSLSSSAAGSLVPDVSKKQHVLIFYSATECGEATAQPHLRVPALRNRGDHFLRFLRLCQLRGVEKSGELQDNDMYALGDGGKEGNRATLLSKFLYMPTDDLDPKTGKPMKPVPLKKSVRTLTLTLSENSLQQRFEKVRGFNALNQVQRVHVVTKGPLSLNVHERLHTPNSSNRGNVLGPYLVDCWEAEPTWRMAVKSKLSVFGRHGARIPVGGQPEDWPLPCFCHGSYNHVLRRVTACVNNDRCQDLPDDRDEEADLDLGSNPKYKARDRNDSEPLLFHTLPKSFLEEMIHSHDVVACIAMGADGKLAECCLESRIPFWGLCYTEEHVEALQARLEARVFHLMLEGTSKLYAPSLKCIVDKNVADVVEEPAAATKKADKKKKRAPNTDPDEIQPQQPEKKKTKGAASGDKKNKDDSADARPDDIMKEIAALAEAAGQE